MTPPATKDRVEPEQQDRGQQKPLIAWRAILAGERGSRLRAQPGEGALDPRRLVVRLRRDEGAGRRRGGGLQHLGLVVCRHDLSLLVALLGDAIALADRDRRPLRGAEAHGHEAHTLFLCTARAREDLVRRLEGLTIAHDHERTVRAALAEREQARALGDRLGDRAARLTYDARIEIVQEEVEGAAIDGDRGEHVAPAGEREQTHTIARAECTEPPDLLLHTLEAAGSLVGGEHRERGVDRQHEIDAGRAHGRPREPPSGAGAGDAGQKSGAAEPDGAPAARRERVRRHEPAHDRERAQSLKPARTFGPSPPEQEEEQHRQRDGQQEEPRHLDRVEPRDHGSRPFHAPSRSSAATAISMIDSGQRNSSAYCTYVRLRTGARSSASICSVMRCSAAGSRARKYRPPVAFATSVSKTSSISTFCISYRRPNNPRPTGTGAIPSVPTPMP